MSTAEKELPRVTVDELLVICRLNERKECLKDIRSPLGRVPDAADLAAALFELDDVTLQWAVRKRFSRCKPFEG